MKISSSSFQNGGAIDPRYAMKAIAGGKNISPQVSINDAPANAKSLAIAFIDHHPVARNWVHWLVVNIPPGTASIHEGASLTAMPAGAVELVNTYGRKGYGGPQPPRGTGVHQYELNVYALSDTLKTGDREYSEKEFLDLVKNKVLAKASISGGFENR
jgi:Raf kinase inhibitor-like YbhB/YbcL family protein